MIRQHHKLSSGYSNRILYCLCTAQIHRQRIPFFNYDRVLQVDGF